MLGHTSTPTLRTDPHERVFNPFYVDSLIAAPVTDGYEDNDEEDDDVDEDIGEEVGQPHSHHRLHYRQPSNWH
jgi:hypothetical protein